MEFRFSGGGKGERRVGSVSHLSDALDSAATYVQEKMPQCDTAAGECFTLRADANGSVIVALTDGTNMRGALDMQSNSNATRLMSAMALGGILKSPATAMNPDDASRVRWMINGALHEAMEGVRYTQGFTAARQKLKDATASAATWAMLNRTRPTEVDALLEAAHAMLLFLEHDGWPSPEMKERMGTKPPPSDLP